MMIYEKLGLNLEKNEVISVVGAGGKTSLICGLTEELKYLDKKVLATTTTQIFNPNNMDYFFLRKINESFIPKKGTITSYGDYISDGKLKGASPSELDDIIKRNIFNYILIEADGAKGKPLKAPASHEPVITKFNSITIGVIGLDSIGLELNESNLHRPELISELTGKNLGELIESEDIIKLLLHKEGIFKDSIGRKILVLNKANSTLRIKMGKYIRNKLFDKDMKVLISNIKTKEFY